MFGVLFWVIGDLLLFVIEPTQRGLRTSKLVDRAERFEEYLITAT